MTRRNGYRRAVGVATELAALAVLPCLAIVAVGAWRAPRLVARKLGPPPQRSVRELPREFERMLLAVEDPRFYEHHGVDFRTPGSGWTTISQALVKVLYFDGFRPGALAKAEQSLLALGFDSAVSKRAQLDLFWNLAYFGRAGDEDVIGFPRAAMVYFGRDVRALERREYLALVAMLIAPNRLSPDRHFAENAERVGRIERLLAGKCRPHSWRDVEYRDCSARR
ncbi:MAG: transglycosylase domain-containing protein [Acidobacteria bacterium]|nr:transglycosylase domain-containing protein [Acidobacteriota bacterium]